MKNVTICFGDTLSILTNVATAHCAIGISAIHAEVIDVTANAVHVAAYTRNGKRVTCWLPLRALIKRSRHDNVTHVSLAKWFKPREWTQRFITCCEDVNIISA
jgi:hypothetical protein